MQEVSVGLSVGLSAISILGGGGEYRGPCIPCWLCSYLALVSSVSYPEGIGIGSSCNHCPV